MSYAPNGSIECLRIVANDSGSLYCLEKMNQNQDSAFLGLFRYYSEIDLKEVDRLQITTKAKRIDIDALYASFDKWSIFCILEDKLKLLKMIY